jgi:hypothetical protein
MAAALDVPALRVGNVGHFAGVGLAADSFGSVVGQGNFHGVSGSRIGNGGVAGRFPAGGRQKKCVFSMKPSLGATEAKQQDLFFVSN